MRAYLALGSNLGDRERYLRDAIDALVDRVDHSSVWEADPVGGPAGQGAFLNLVVALETTKSPRELLEVARALEHAAGRVREQRWGPRTLDVDVIMVGDLVVDEPDLVVPHPLWRERAFVVEPLREVADAALLAKLPTDLDTTGIRKAPSLWGDFDLSVRPEDAAKWMQGWEGPWAVAGGWAIELFVGRPVREHNDLEIAIARVDAPRLHDHLQGWQFFFPAPAAFTRWRRGEAIPPKEHQLWSRASPDAAWTLEIMFEDISDGVLRYRRDPAITLPLDEAFLRTADGIPYVAPHLQLLYKAKYARPRDETDRAAAVPLLSDAQRAWLDSHLLPS
ncbi:MAG TPA: 2-amino-4-hydroxy-6-hydroxymethyldihydropteridine diphosphokinase [Acidimicrobiales bacterium]|nr:2-amino-4-hydroxy-6-hydroxymethyldihydropteridine diphosphokinase [Acidimicrobiales bacterium]